MHAEILSEIGALATTDEDSDAVLQEALSLLKGVIPYAAASVTRWNPIAEKHETFINDGYSKKVIDHLDNYLVVHEPVFFHMRHKNSMPLNWRTTPFPGGFRETYSAQEVLIPEGFAEGVTAVLFARDGRYTGSVHMSLDDPNHPDDDAMRVMQSLQGVFAGTVDAMRTVRRIATTIDPEANTALLATDGRVLPIPGRATGAHLVPDGELPKLLIKAVVNGTLRPMVRWRDGDGHWHVVRTHLHGTELVATETVSPLPREITSREVEVLNGLLVGHSNAEIAAQLHLSGKTVGKHVEHIMDKLQSRSRAGVAVQALTEGLALLTP